MRELKKSKLHYLQEPTPKERTLKETIESQTKEAISPLFENYTVLKRKDTTENVIQQVETNEIIQYAKKDYPQEETVGKQFRPRNQTDSSKQEHVEKQQNKATQPKVYKSSSQSQINKRTHYQKSVRSSLLILIK